MANKYQVGQQVRIVRASARPELVGTVAVVWRGSGPSFSHPQSREYYIIDAVDGRYYAHEECLAPLGNDDGWQKTTWDKCLWRPKTKHPSH